MTDTSENKEPEIKVTQFRMKNRLKERLGSMRVVKHAEEGEIAEEKVEEANALIADLCVNCLDDIGENLEKLNDVWREMQDPKNAEIRKELSQKIFTYSHEIKDIASLCGYNLAAHFAESLRDYIAETAMNLQNQKIIIQAHVDAMTVVHKNNLKEDGGPAAEELKKMVKIAIDKYR